MYIYLLEPYGFLDYVRLYSHTFTHSSSFFMMQIVLVISMVAAYILIGFVSILFASDVRTNWANLKWGKRFQAERTSEKHMHIVICGNINYKDLAGWLWSGWPTYTLLRIVVVPMMLNGCTTTFAMAACSSSKID